MSKFDLETEREIYRLGAEVIGVLPVSQREIQYIDVKPQPMVVQIPLVEYFERVKRLKADRWQIDFCRRLQEAAEQREFRRFWDLYHAEGQLGKTSILSQAFPAWAIGHQPLFRFALATYNVTRSQSHSDVVINILKSPIHQDIFPDKAGHLARDKSSKAGWMTNARRELNDGQLSYNPVGLESGLTGSGFDWLVIDDPYADVKDAFSDTVRHNLIQFWEFTVGSRIGLYANVTGMFHRYASDDLAGYLLNTGDFDYIRYASQADGDYHHPETGKRFPDPLNRVVGEYISPERRPPAYYDKVKKNKRVWLSMFQGRPSSEEGDFFNVGKISTITKEEGSERRRECAVMVRAWDLAATEAGGDYSVGALLGMRSDGTVTIFEIVRKQVDTAGRDELQKRTAARDGTNVIIAVPQDPAAAGKSLAFHIQQMLKGYTVVLRSTSGSKENRARNFAGAVNSGMIEFVEDADLPDEMSIDDVTKWNEPAKKELRDFPLSAHLDITDALSDAYSESYERLIKGLVVSNYKPQRNLVTFSAFAARFPHYSNNKLLLKIPLNFQIYAALKISADASLPTCGILTARASENSGLGDTIFCISEYKKYDGSYENLIKWLKDALEAFTLQFDVNNTTVWLHKGSAHYQQTITEKLKTSVATFDGDALLGLAETNWYLMPKTNAHPFNAMEFAAGMYFLVHDSNLSNAEEANNVGFYHARQEMATWGYNDKGEPTKIGAVLDCLRMCVAEYATFATPLTVNEEYQRRLKAMLPVQLQGEIELPPEQTIGYSDAMTLQMNEMMLRRQLKEEGALPDSPYDEEDYSPDLSGGY